jgi:hypothetical protein
LGGGQRSRAVPDGSGLVVAKRSHSCDDQLSVRHVMVDDVWPVAAHVTGDLHAEREHPRSVEAARPVPESEGWPAHRRDPRCPTAQDLAWSVAVALPCDTTLVASVCHRAHTRECRTAPATVSLGQTKPRPTTRCGTSDGSAPHTARQALWPRRLARARRWPSTGGLMTRLSGEAAQTLEHTRPAGRLGHSVGRLTSVRI